MRSFELIACRETSCSGGEGGEGGGEGGGGGGASGDGGGSPPSPPPLPPGSRYALSSSDLIAALSDGAVSRIVLKSGIYEFADDMCPDLGWWLSSALCIDRPVTIEAEVAGSVVLDAKGARRVIYVAATGRAELVGLNITGGFNSRVGFLTPFEPKCSSHLSRTLMVGRIVAGESTSRAWRC